MTQKCACESVDNTDTLYAFEMIIWEIGCASAQILDTPRLGIKAYDGTGCSWKNAVPI